MKLSISLLVPALFGTAIAAFDSANVYTFPASNPQSSTSIPTLSPEEARLVIAQRLGVSQYHDLHDVTSDGIRYVNTFGGQRSTVFGSLSGDDDRSHLVLMVEGITAQLEESVAASWEGIKPAFKISNPPAKAANSKLIEDITAQSSAGGDRKDCPLRDAINPFQQNCWSGWTNFVHFDIQSSKDASQEFLEIAQLLLRYAKDDTMEIMVILMPASNQNAQSARHPYGSYDMPSHLHHTRSPPEELIDFEGTGEPPLPPSDAQAPKNAVKSTSAPNPMKTIMPRCHGSVDSCIAATGNCSGHGACRNRYGAEDKNACFACSCIASVNITDGFKQSIYWGGPACQKEDISSQFWLLAGFSVAAVGIVSWGIGLLFSIGEEQLPGVIGAGVSGPKAR